MTSDVSDAGDVNGVKGVNGVNGDILDTYSVESLEQLRVLSDQLRVSVVTLVAARPMTVTQVADALGQAPAKIHYHMRELERVGLVKIVETREKGGILEKYYRSIARTFDTSPSLFLQPSAGEDITTITRDTLRQRLDAFLRAARVALRHTQQGDETALPRTIGLDSSQVWLAPSEFRGLVREMLAIISPYQAPRGIPGEREYTFVLFAHDTQAGQLSPTQAGGDAPEENEPGQRTGRGPRRVVLAGVLSYSRADLEQVAARDEHLDIHVLGYCAFADDVTPELVRRVITRFRYQGVLSAPDSVRAVLDSLGQDEAGA